MSRGMWVRQAHRWVSLAFTLTVITNIIALSVAKGEPPDWVTDAPLPPLFVLLFTGLYLFALPYTVRWRRSRRPEMTNVL